MQTTTVQLTEYEAKDFILAQKYRVLLGLLESIGVAEMRDGSITIHFNHNGEIRTVDKHEYYRT